MTVHQLPLSGITVVSLEQAVAAPYATRQLADLGARVIKVERPGEGDFARRYDTTVHGHSSYFVWLNRSKESLTLDLKDPRGMEILHQLLDGRVSLRIDLADGSEVHSELALPPGAPGRPPSETDLRAKAAACGPDVPALLDGLTWTGAAEVLRKHFPYIPYEEQEA